MLFNDRFDLLRRDDTPEGFNETAEGVLVDVFGAIQGTGKRSENGIRESSLESLGTLDRIKKNLAVFLSEKIEDLFCFGDLGPELD